MSHRLLVNPGTPQAWEIPLKPGVNRIGRGEQNDFTISHGSVSTRHCEITISDTAVILKDLGSTNGTFVERAPITEIHLRPGQHVQFGAVDMIFESSTASAPAPIPAATVSAEPPPPPPIPVPTVAGLRINRAAPEAPPTPAAAPGAGFTPMAPIAGFRPGTDPADDGEKRSFGLSLTGVILGAVLGAVVWHLIYRFTDKNFGIMALATGVLAGVAPQLMGHYRGKLMGFIAATVALVAILTTQYFNTRHEMESDRQESEQYLYEEELEYAKRATQAIPEGTEAEVRAFLATEESFGEYKPKPEEMDPEEVAELQKELPKYRDLVAGKITPEQLAKLESDPEVDEFVAKLDRIFFLVSVLGVFNIVNIFLGVGAAFLTAKGDRR
jgi:hypothetical protein